MSNNTNSEIKVHIIECGKIKNPAAIRSRKNILKMSSLGKLFNSSKERATSEELLPIHCFLIEHPLGNVLVDTGPDSCIVGKLEERGFAPSNIDVITLSCLDADHSGGLKALVEAGENLAKQGAKSYRTPEILIADEELYWMQRNVFRSQQPIENIENVKHTRFFYKACQDGPHRYKYDVFGDESILLYLCTGHTFGTVATLVTNLKTGKKIILASDIILDTLTFEESTVFHRTYQDKSIKWLREQAEDQNCVAILPTHDKNLKEEIIEF